MQKEAETKRDGVINPHNYNLRFSNSFAFKLQDGWIGCLTFNDISVIHRKMCNMRFFLKRMLNVPLTHGKRVNRVTDV